jgi:hypothetical protein
LIPSATGVSSKLPIAELQLTDDYQAAKLP